MSTMSEDLDAIQRASRNERSTGLSEDDRAKIRAEAESKALDRDPAADRARVAAAKRATFVRGVLRVQAESMRHGDAYDEHDRAELVDDIVASIGDVTPAAKSRIERFVKIATDAIAGGDKSSGLADAEDAAIDVANALRAHWSAPEVPSPAEMAEQVPRSRF